MSRLKPAPAESSASPGPMASGARREQTRARDPDDRGFVDRDGVRVAWERYGEGSPTILLMPTWSVVHSRHWKLQIPFLARLFRVVTFDGRGNGRSDRPVGPSAYADVEFAEDAAAVLDASGTEQAVVAGFSMGAGYGIRLAVDHPERVLGLVLFGASVDVLDQDPGSGDGPDRSFEEPQPDDDDWHRYNAHYWRRDWPGFAAWFTGEKVFSEPHSTKPIEDFVGWFLETDPETIIATERAPYLRPPDGWAQTPTEGRAVPFVRRVRCPTLVVHGDDDQIVGVRNARRLAQLLGAPLVEVAGGGHGTIGRDPVLANLLIRDFVRGLDVGP